MRKKTILIIDDDASLRKTLSDILKAKGYVPVTAATGKRALDIVEKQMPDVALIDLKLKDMSGLNIIRKIKECYPGTECVMITAFASKESVIHAINLGAYSYVQKPYDMNQLLVTIQRIIEKQNAEEALRKNEDNMRTILDSMPDVVLQLDTKLEILWANKATIKLNPHAVGQLCYKALPRRNDPCPGCSIVKALKTGQIERGIVHFQSVTGVGESYWDDIGIPIKDTRGKVTSIVKLARNITENKKEEKKRKKLEAQLQQAQKMESIGTLAGGIAHDFNNILTCVSGYTELALDNTEKGTQLHDNLQEVFSSSKRATDLVKQILTFSRQSDQELKPLQVHLVVREALKLIRATLPSTIEIKHNISNRCGLVMADASQIHQVAMNLFTNAFKAMEDDGGKLDVTLKEVDLDVDDLKSPAMVPGPYVCLTVSDTGTGIDKSVINRIFDPYFSTKEKHKGTGLGLAMVHGLIKGYGGNIRVYSEPGKGTEFHVYLPVIQIRAETKETRVISPVQMGTERILFVDDEDQIVRMSQQMLEDLGYHVTTRTSSIETLEAFRAAPDKFDLVITDTTMPNMTGVELAKKLMEIRSDIPIIICTGFSKKISADKAKAMGIRGYIMKPVGKSKLANKIREVLDQS